MKTFLQVHDNNGRSTSSLLTTALRAGIKILVGVDAFKSAWKAAPTSRGAIATMQNTTGQAIDASLRMNGQDPHAYYSKLDELLGDHVDTLDTAAINDALAKADSASKDSSQQFLLWGGIGLLMLMAFTGFRYRKGIRKVFHRARYRFTAWRSARRARRAARRGRR